MQTQIEKGIPIPSKSKVFSELPYKDMEVGDSIFVKQIKGKPLNLLYVSVYSSAADWAKRNKNNWKFTGRVDKEKNGVRLWRMQ